MIRRLWNFICSVVRPLAPSSNHSESSCQQVSQAPGDLDLASCGPSISDVLPDYPMDMQTATIGLSSSLSGQSDPRLASSERKTMVLTGVRIVKGCDALIGAFSDVFPAEYRGSRVALKKLRVHTFGSEAQRERFIQALVRESVYWRSLSHEHILPCLGLAEGSSLGRACMVSPWMENRDLRSYVSFQRESGALTGDAFALFVDNWLRQTALGLAYLCAQGIVHGDIHAGNVLVDEEGKARLGDYGLSVILENSSSEHGHAHHGFSAHFPAPELIHPQQFGFNHWNPTFSSDVYAFGCFCVEVYTGQSPLKSLGANDFHRFSQIIRGVRPPRPSLSDGNCCTMSDAMWSLTTSCWAQEAAQRPSAEKTAQTLTDIVGEKTPESLGVVLRRLPPVVAEPELRRTAVTSSSRNLSRGRWNYFAGCFGKQRSLSPDRSFVCDEDESEYKSYRSDLPPYSPY